MHQIHRNPKNLLKQQSCITHRQFRIQTIPHSDHLALGQSHTQTVSFPHARDHTYHTLISPSLSSCIQHFYQYPAATSHLHQCPNAHIKVPRPPPPAPYTNQSIVPTTHHPKKAVATSKCKKGATTHMNETPLSFPPRCKSSLPTTVNEICVAIQNSSPQNGVLEFFRGLEQATALTRGQCSLQWCLLLDCGLRSIAFRVGFVRKE